MAQLNIATTEDLDALALKLHRMLEQTERRITEMLDKKKANLLGYEQRPFISPKEFAHLVGVDKSTVCRWCRLGVVRAKQVGSKGSNWMIQRDEVDRMIKETNALEPQPLYRA